MMKRSVATLGLALAALASPMVAEAAAPTITSARIENQRLIVAGKGTPGAVLRLDGRFSVTVNGQGNYAFNVAYAPADCVIDIVPQATPSEKRSAAVANCGTSAVGRFGGAWTGTAAYLAGDLVTRRGATWRARRANGGKDPVNSPLDWAVFAAVGPTGPQGPRGPIGPRGAAGPAGAVGPAGDTGPQGPVGDQGPQGSQGPQGFPGFGEQGETGVQGPVGQTGPSGPISGALSCQTGSTGTSTILGGSSGGVIAPSCATGFTAVSVNCDANLIGAYVVDAIIDGGGARCYINNPFGTTANVTAVAVCCRLPASE
jgi:hypothetical protein